MAQLFLRKTSFNFEIWVTFDQSQRMALTLTLTQLHKLIYLNASSNLGPKAAIDSKKNNQFFPYKSLRDQRTRVDKRVFWPQYFRKIEYICLIGFILT